MESDASPVFPQTEAYLLTSQERLNYVDMLLALWPSLRWRHAGFGALQAYIAEGEGRELRAHLWHPSLVKTGIVESSLCHDHRFDMRSSVLVGCIRQTEFRLRPAPDGQWETWRVLHARAAAALGGSFHHEPEATGEFFDRHSTIYRFHAGEGYTFNKFAFHETQAEAITITLVEKSNQENVNARILAPRGAPLVHAFTDTLQPDQFEGVLRHGFEALLSSRTGAKP